MSKLPPRATNVPVDENGVPYWSGPALELKAEQVLRSMKPSALIRPERVSIAEVAKSGAERGWLKLEVGVDLGYTRQGSKILGEFLFRPPTIRIDESIISDPRFDFTLAHEFAHFVLHRKTVIKSSDYTENEIRDTERDFITGHKVLTTPRDWVEWQANQLASAILLPRQTILAAVVQSQRAIGIKRNLGRIYVDTKQYSRADFDRLLEQLQLIFGTSKEAIRNRLGDLNIIDDHTDDGMRHITKAFLRAS